MAKEFHAEIDIAATPEAVWAVLSDLTAWPRFDPQTKRTEGTLAQGAKIIVESTLAPGRAFSVKITAFDPARKLEWDNTFALGALKSIRTHTLTPFAGGTHFEIHETISGPMLKAIGDTLPDIGNAFAGFCRGLKEAVESGRRSDAAPAPVTPRALTMTRRFDAAPGQVFNSWIDPERTRLWLFTSPGSDSNVTEIDARLGGKWSISDTRDGVRYTAEGEYLEFDRPHRLAFSFGMPQFSSNTDTITVELKPDGDGTMMTFTQSGTDVSAELAALPEGGRGGTETGWHYMFLGLAEVAQGRVPVIPPQSHV